MPEIVIFDREHNLVTIISTDLVGLEDLAKSLDSVNQIVHEQGLNKVLIDATNLKLMPSPLHLHGFAYELSKQAKNMKFAIVVSEQSPKGVRCLETAAQARGVIIKTFPSQNDALAWLKQ